MIALVLPRINRGRVGLELRSCLPSVTHPTSLVDIPHPRPFADYRCFDRMFWRKSIVFNSLTLQVRNVRFLEGERLAQVTQMVHKRLLLDVPR